MLRVYMATEDNRFGKKMHLTRCSSKIEIWRADGQE